VNTLFRFENLFEQLIEKSFSKIFKTRLHPADLAKALARAMDESMLDDGHHGLIAPNVYRVFLNPDDFEALLTQVDLDTEITAVKRYLQALITEAHSDTLADIQVSIAARDDISIGGMKIIADHISPPTADSPTTGDTKRFAPLPSAIGQWQLGLPEKTVALGMPIVRIGRAEDNDVIISHPTVSRHHVQLRWHQGQYYLQNLSHSQPVGVNRQLVQETIALQAGDVLHLGQVSVTFDKK